MNERGLRNPFPVVDLLESAPRAAAASLSIDEFDQWTNPNGLRLGGTIWCKSEPCEGVA